MSSTSWDGEALAALLGVRVVVHGTIDSTIETAARDAGSRPVLHLAERQRRGRGRRGRRWESPGGNLYATAVWADPAQSIPPSVLAAIQVALAEALAASGGPEAGCKWPNDGYLGGRKWCGVMAMRLAAGEDLLVSLGANLEIAPTVESTALRDHWPEWPGREEAGAILLKAIVDLLRQGREGIDQRLARWHAHDVWKIGDTVQIGTNTGARIGLYAGVTPAGRLRLDTDDGAEEFVGGEVSLVRRFDDR